MEFAKILNLTRYKFRSLENGKVLPSQEMAMKMVEILEVTIEDVFFIEETQR